MIKVPSRRSSEGSLEIVSVPSGKSWTCSKSTVAHFCLGRSQCYIQDEAAVSFRSPR